MADFKTAVDLLQQRVRQEGNIAITQNFATTVLSRCERLINTYLRRVTASIDFATTAYETIYDYRADFVTQDTAYAVDILHVTESDREIPWCSMADLSAYDQAWFRRSVSEATGRFEFWTQIGRDAFILYPAKDDASEVTIEYSKLVTGYTTYASVAAVAFELPRDDAEYAIALAEIILLSRSRQFTTVQSRMKTLIKALMLHKVEMN